MPDCYAKSQRRPSELLHKPVYQLAIHTLLGSEQQPSLTFTKPVHNHKIITDRFEIARPITNTFLSCYYEFPKTLVLFILVRETLANLVQKVENSIFVIEMLKIIQNENLLGTLSGWNSVQLVKQLNE